MPKVRRRSKVVRLPTNVAICSAIIKRNHDRIIGASFKIGRRYNLLPEDREELVSHVHFKISKVDWRQKFHNNLLWVRINVVHPSANWTPEEIAKVMNGYAYTLIQKSMLDEVRRIKCGGLSGLGLHPIAGLGANSLPLAGITHHLHNDFGFDDYREKLEGESDFQTLEPGADGQADRTAANQVAELARQMLTAEEWICVSLAFGFDGGDSRTPTQVAREAKLPRKRAQELLDSAMGKLRVRVSSDENSETEATK